MERIIVYENVIGSYSALRVFIKDWSTFRDANIEEIEYWKKLNK